MRGDASEKGFERLHRASALVLISAILFCLFFQINKSGPLLDANPSVEDPYDAIDDLWALVRLPVSGARAVLGRYLGVRPAVSHRK
jgi:hypothetical protein